jgi:HAD superfamily hydrolase (TIGR01509 family)
MIPNDPMLKGLLFDLDGTLANTDPLHLQIWQSLLRPYGYEIDLAFYQRHISGRLNADILANLLPQLDASEAAVFGAHKETLFRQLAVDQLTPTAGLAPLLDWVEYQGWVTAVVTNAPRDNAEFMLATLNLSQRFQTLVIADDLPQAKPHPRPYLEALQRLNLSPDQAIAFEDSRTGVMSAAAAGLYTVGIATTHQAADLQEAGAKTVISDFCDAALQQLGLLAGSGLDPD